MFLTSFDIFNNNFLGQNLSNFVFLSWQLDNLRCHTAHGHRVQSGIIKLVHVILYVILGCYFGMISWNFGMKIYHYLLHYLANQQEVCLPNIITNFRHKITPENIVPMTWKGLILTNRIFRSNLDWALFEWSWSASWIYPLGRWHRDRKYLSCLWQLNLEHTSLKKCNIKLWKVRIIKKNISDNAYLT